MTNLRWKLTHTSSWKNAQATVDSCEWVKSHEHAGEISGHYQVKFTYPTGDSGETNHGDFCHHGIRHIVPYSVGERLPIQFDPKKPSRYHYSGADANYEKLEAILAVMGFALLAGYFLYAF